MPRLCPIDPTFAWLLASQDHVVSIDQAQAAGMSRRAIDHALTAKGWQRLLPGVFLAAPTEPTRRQLMIAALLYVGPDGAIDDVDACRFHGVKAFVPDDDVVRVVVPQDHVARSTAFLVVRRSTAAWGVVTTERLRYVDAATAVIAVARRTRSERAVLALISDAVQRRIVSHDELLRAHVRASPRGAGRTDEALAQVGAGVRSAPEGDFRRLAESSLVLPPLLYNRVLLLPSGLRISPDALAPDAALVHETNGRTAHSRADLFDDMQERHDVMTDAGLTVLHSSPGRLSRKPRVVIGQFERVYLRDAGRGLPPGVSLLPDRGYSTL